MKRAAETWRDNGQGLWLFLFEEDNVVFAHDYHGDMARLMDDACVFFDEGCEGWLGNALSDYPNIYNEVSNEIQSTRESRISSDVMPKYFYRVVFETLNDDYTPRSQVTSDFASYEKAKAYFDKYDLAKEHARKNCTGDIISTKMILQCTFGEVLDDCEEIEYAEVM